MPGTGTGYAKAVPSTLHIVYSPSIQPPPPLRSSIKKTSYLFNSVFEKNLARSRGLLRIYGSGAQAFDSRLRIKLDSFTTQPAIFRVFAFIKEERLTRMARKLISYRRKCSFNDYCNYT